VLVLSNRPTVVLADVRIDLPDHRDQLRTRSSAQFAQTRRHVYELVQLAKKGHRPATA
jgi:NitT/TauT family transport system ATP-binding protein